MKAVMLATGAALGLLLAGCATTQKASAPSTPSAPPGPGAMAADEGAFRSTYKAWPGTATVIRNVTIFDGLGGRIDNGAVRFEAGKVVAVGQTVLETNATVIDGAGKWVTPGIIDIHSHLGNYPSPGVQAHSDGNEVTGPVRPEVQPGHRRHRQSR